MNSIEKELDEIRDNENQTVDDLIEYAIHIIRAFSTLVDTDGIYYVNEEGGINFKPWKK